MQAAGIILAGGLSRRMGGDEKSRIRLAGKTMLEWVDAEQVALVAAGFLKQWISDQLLLRVAKY